MTQEQFDQILANKRQPQPQPILNATQQFVKYVDDKLANGDPKPCSKCRALIWNSDGTECDRCHFAATQERRRAKWLFSRAGIGLRHTRFSTWAALADGPPGCRAMIDAVRQFCEARDAGILALLGKRGTGKTQVAAVAVMESIRAMLEACQIATTSELLADAKSRFEDIGGDADWVRDWSRPWLLVIDEFNRRCDSDWGLLMLEALLDRRYRDCKRTILIANATAQDFAAIAGASIADRIREGGGIIECDWASFRGAT